MTEEKGTETTTEAVANNGGPSHVAVILFRRTISFLFFFLEELGWLVYYLHV